MSASHYNSNVSGNGFASNHSEQTLSELSKAPHITWFKAVMELICFTIGVIGILGNSVVVTVYRRKTRRKATEILILCLSCLDLVYCICNDIIQVILIILEHHPPSPTAQTIVDLILNFLFTSLPYMSWLMILNITVNRYIAVCHAFKYQTIYTLKLARNVVLAIVLLSALIGIPTFAIALLDTTQRGNFMMVYQGMRAALVVIVCTAMFVMYSRVVNKLRSQNKNTMLYSTHAGGDDETCLCSNAKPARSASSRGNNSSTSGLSFKMEKTTKSEAASEADPGVRANNGTFPEEAAREGDVKENTENAAVDNHISGSLECESVIKVECHQTNGSFEMAQLIPKKNHQDQSPLSNPLSGDKQGLKEGVPQKIQLNGKRLGELDQTTPAIEIADHEPEPQSKAMLKSSGLKRWSLLNRHNMLGADINRAGRGSRRPSQKTSSAGNAVVSQAKINSDRRARRTTVTLWIVCCVFLGLNFPNAFIMIIRGYTDIEINPGMNDISLTMYTLSFAVNPFIYYFTNSAFKEDVREVFPCLRSQSQHVPT